MTSTELVVSQNRPDASPTAFDYNNLALDVAKDVRSRADPIHQLRRASVLEIGRELIAAKRLVGHGLFREGSGTPTVSRNFSAPGPRMFKTALAKRDDATRRQHLGSYCMQDVRTERGLTRVLRQLG